MIQVEGLTKDYSSRRAIEDLTFHANQGEILGFLGPNGAGKTTTMRILTGYMPPSAGKAQVAGFDVVDQSLDVRRRVGYMPETIPLYPDMAVFEYLKFMADLRRVPDVDERVDDLLDRLGLLDRAESYISNLSKGMRQRVGLAQALVHDPDVLILDEPTIGLDPKQIFEVRSLIKSLAGDHTVILSTHILPEVSMTCSRVVIINKAKVVAMDTPQGLTNQAKGAERVALVVDGPREAVEEKLTSIDGVLRVEVTGGDEGQPLNYMVECKLNSDLRRDLASAVVSQGWGLMELRAVSMSLEDVFINLVTKE